MNSNRVFYIIGVSGVGKSTIGELLSKELKIPYFDGDDFHPEENISKMSSGKPLTDNDRLGWLVAINQFAKEQLGTNSCIIACSALKESYREILSEGINGQTKWVYLYGTFEQIEERINKRSNHFMTTDLLRSQFDTLEDPSETLKLDVTFTPEEITETVKKELIDTAEFGLFGLGVMGKSLSRNLAKKGFKISIYNREVAAEKNVAINFKNEFDELSEALPFDTVKDFVDSLQKPRKIFLMVTEKVVDLVIEALVPLLSEGDVLIDGGNSNYIKTQERIESLKSKKIHLIGAGVSGGEEGALTGPSIMPGGNKTAYKMVQPFLEAVAARDAYNLPCCSYIGKDGSGHFVKMIHNGIEYVEMQLLTEVLSILKTMGKDYDEIAAVFESWKKSVNSYLLEITIEILRKKEKNDWLLNKIVDKAGYKGTGNWATIAAAELGVPGTLIASALFARYTSYYKDDRVELSKIFSIEKRAELNISSQEILEAYQFARLINHYQGFKLISESSKAFQWDMNLSEIARIWTNGCIIKSSLMADLVKVFERTDNLLTHERYIQHIKKLKPAAKKTVSHCVLNEVFIPCLSDALNFFNGYTEANSSANLIQAQRDFFGAHTYQRTDDDSDSFYHTDWNEKD